MCLVNYKNKFVKKIADKDIECYKIVYQWNPQSNVVEAEYQNFYYTINKEYSLNKEIDILSEYDEYSIDGNSSKEYIYEGFHSYKYLEDAKKEINDFSRCRIIVKCVIPKGSTYYEGHYGLDGLDTFYYNNYVSDRIKIVEKL